MLKWLDDNGISMYSTHSEGKSVVAETFIKILSWLFELLIDEYNNIYHNSFGKKPVDADYSAMSEKIEAKSKSLKLKADDRVRITKSIIFLAKVTTKIGRKKYL